jgi:hypothetical protein
MVAAQKIFSNHDSISINFKDRKEEGRDGGREERGTKERRKEERKEGR